MHASLDRSQAVLRFPLERRPGREGWQGSERYTAQDMEQAPQKDRQQTVSSALRRVASLALSSAVDWVQSGRALQGVAVVAVLLVVGQALRI